MEYLEVPCRVRNRLFDEALHHRQAADAGILREVLRPQPRCRVQHPYPVDTIDRETVKLLKRAGLRSIHMGVEAGANRVLKS